MDNLTERIAVRLPRDTKQQLEYEANRQRRKIGAMARVFIEEGLANLNYEFHIADRDTTDVNHIPPT